MSSDDDAMRTMIRNLEQNTGKSLAQWASLASGLGGKHGEIVKRLKDDHGLTHGYANLVAHEALKSAASHQAEDDLLAAQYVGAKAALRPIYDALAEAVAGFGQDVEFAPKKGYVSLRRSKQFGLIQPSTATRVDVGIQLKGTAPTARLEASGSFNAMVSHRVRLAGAADVDAELIGWLRAAYAPA